MPNPSAIKYRMGPALVAALIHAGIVVAAWFAFGDELLLAHDGQHFAALALDPLALGDPDVDHIAYRAMRVGMPLLAWPVSWLGPTAALGIVQVVAVAIGVHACSNLAARRGLTRWLGLSFAVLPGVLVSSRTLVADAVAAAFMLAAADRWERQVRAWPWATMAVLSKETMLLAVVGWALFNWRRLIAPITIFVVWLGTLVMRFGWTSPSDTIEVVPFVGWVDTLAGWSEFAVWEEAVGGLGLLALGVVVAVTAARRRTPLSISALTALSVFPFLGVGALQYAVHSYRMAIYPLAIAILEWPAARQHQPAESTDSSLQR